MPRTDAHPSPDDLRAFALGLLPAGEAAAVETHLADCFACTRRLDELPADGFLAALRAARSGSTAATPAGSAVSLHPRSLEGPPPELVGHPRYTLGELLGRGGMGTVFRAEHALMGRPVALKVIAPRLLEHPGAADRFRREVRAAATLDHPHIVTAFDAEEVGPLTVLVMEYVPGRTLAERLEEVGPLPAAEAAGYARQAALGLAHAHARGMVHRDIKPANLMLTPGGVVKILDFGLARLAEPDPADLPPPDPAAPTTPGVTHTGVVLGTADYVAPEQAEDPRAACPRADVYALGATLYHLLAGRVAFPGGGAAEKLYRLAYADPTPLGAIRPDLPPGLVRVVERMMAKRPEDRYPTAAAAAEALAPFAAGRQRRRFGSRMVVALAVLVAAMAVVGVILLNRPADRPGGVDRPQEVMAPTPQPEPPGPEIAPPPRAVERLSPAPPADLAPGRHFPYAHGNMRFPIVHPTGRHLLAADGTGISVWELGTGERVRVLAGLEPRAMAVRVTPDGATVVGVSEAGRVVGWDWETGRTVAEFTVPGCPQVTGLALIDGGRRVVVPAAPGSVSVRSFPDGDEVGRIDLGKPGEFVYTIDASPDGRLVAVTGGDGRTVVWDGAAGRPVATLPPVEVAYGYATCGFSPDGRFLAVGAGNGLRVWEVERWGEPAAAVETDASGMVGFDPTNGLVATAPIRPPAGIAVVTWWDRRSMRPVRQAIASIGQDWNHCGLAPDGRTVIVDHQARRGFVLVAPADVAPRTFGYEGHRPAAAALVGPDAREAILVAHNSTVSALLWHPDGRRLVSAGGEGAGTKEPVVRVWDHAGRRLVRELAGHERGITAAALFPDGRRLVTADHVGDTRVWDLDTGQLLRRMNHGRRVMGVAVSPDGRRVLTTGSSPPRVWKPGTAQGLERLLGPNARMPDPNDWTPRPAARLWDADTGAPLRVFLTPPGLTSRDADASARAAFLPDGKRAVTAGWDDGSLSIWDVDAGREVKRLTPPPPGGPVHALAACPNGRWVVAGGDDGRVRVWDVETGDVVRDWKLEGMCHTVAADPSGRHAVAAGEPPLVRVWDIAGDVPASWVPARRPVMSAAFSADGRVAVGTFDGMVVTWDLPREKAPQPREKGP